MEESKEYLRKDRIYEHLDNLNRQLEDLERLPEVLPILIIYRRKARTFHFKTS